MFVRYCTNRKFVRPLATNWKFVLQEENVSMYLSPEEQAIGHENFCAAMGSKLIRRELLKKAIKAEVASGKGLGPLYFGYERRFPSRFGWA